MGMCKENIEVESLTMQAKGVTIFKDAELNIIAGRRYGLIGPNGCGKTTLLAKLANRLPTPSSITLTLTINLTLTITLTLTFSLTVTLTLTRTLTLHLK